MRCLFCNSVSIKLSNFPRTVFYNDKLFNYYSCRSCNLVFIHPTPTPEDFKKMYSSSYHENFYFKNETKHPGAANIAEQFIIGKKVLDYGCGDASFIKNYHKKGYSGVAVEYEKALVQRLQNETEGIRFYTPEDFFLNENENSFSMIHLGDVLEHIAEPNELLEKLHKYLIKGSGVLFVEGPLENNFHLALMVRKAISLIARFFNKKNSSHAPYHITFSNFSNQEQLFLQNHFDTQYYKIFETGWPYPEKAGRSITGNMKYIIAMVSIYLSKLFNSWGNRFIYIGKAR